MGRLARRNCLLCGATEYTQLREEEIRYLEMSQAPQTAFGFLDPVARGRPGAAWVTSVAMESTGVYWVPLYEILEGRSFEVVLVNARHVKNVPGRKSDVTDCEWLRELHSVGLLRGSFRPTAVIAVLRAYLVRPLPRARPAHPADAESAWAGESAAPRRHQ
jgi:hypothetical protein